MRGTKFLIGLAGLFLIPGSLRSQGQDHPNVIIMDICSARADHFGTYGAPKKQNPTPNIDKVASQGAVFENAMAQGSWCLPNYGSLFTGHVPEVHGLYTNYRQGFP